MRKRIRTISQLGRDGEFPLLALDHTEKALVPALDNLANAESEIESVVGAVAVIGRGVKLLAGGKEGSGLEGGRVNELTD